MSASERFFCAAASRHAGETLYGTVARTRSWLLLEYPGVWRHNAIEDSRLLSSETRAFLRGAAERAILIRQSHHRAGPLRCFRVDCCTDPPSMSVCTIDDFDRLPEQAGNVEPASGVIYAACTHARHDKCCAKFGLPVFCALRDAAGEHAWQCSHIGGDRFAGNVVVFPWGLYYGRVTPDDVPHLLRATERGEIWMPGFRGRCCYIRNVQVAEYYARAESGRLAINEFTPVSSRPGQVRLAARSDGSLHDVEFQIQSAGLRGRLSCGAEDPSPIAQYRLSRYRVTAHKT